MLNYCETKLIHTSRSAQAIKNMNENILSLEQLQALVEYLPTRDEIRMVKNHVEKVSERYL